MSRRDELLADIKALEARIESLKDRHAYLLKELAKELADKPAPEPKQLFTPDQVTMLRAIADGYLPPVPAAPPRPEFLTTREFAAAIGARPQTLRSHFCVRGSYFGVLPKKAPNGRLLWPSNAVDQFVNKGKK
jgi:hypothetical protein